MAREIGAIIPRRAIHTGSSARKVGGGLDAVVAMTGHKDFKLADHYSKLDLEYQRELSLKIMGVIREKERAQEEGFEIVVRVEFGRR